MTSALEPYTILWSTVSQFYDKFSSWMNGPFMRLNPEEVEVDTNDGFRRVRGWFEFEFESRLDERPFHAPQPRGGGGGHQRRIQVRGRRS